jgi:hypothetical protein
MRRPFSRADFFSFFLFFFVCTVHAFDEDTCFVASPPSSKWESTESTKRVPVEVRIMCQLDCMAGSWRRITTVPWSFEPHRPHKFLSNGWLKGLREVTAEDGTAPSARAGSVTGCRSLPIHSLKPILSHLLGWNWRQSDNFTVTRAILAKEKLRADGLPVTGTRLAHLLSTDGQSWATTNHAFEPLADTACCCRSPSRS